MVNCMVKDTKGESVEVRWSLFLYSAIIGALREEGYARPMSEFCMTFSKDFRYTYDDKTELVIPAGYTFEHWSQ